MRTFPFVGDRRRLFFDGLDGGVCGLGSSVGTGFLAGESKFVTTLSNLSVLLYLKQDTMLSSLVQILD